MRDREAHVRVVWVGFVVVRGLDVLAVDDFRDLVLLQNLFVRRCSDVADVERPAAWDGEDGADVLVETTGAGLGLKAVEGVGLGG